MHSRRRTLALLALAMAMAMAPAAAAVPSSPLSLLVLDVAGRATAAAPSSPPGALFVPQQDACAQWCRAVGGCDRWLYCAQPDGGCGSGCAAHVAAAAAAKQEITKCVGPTKDAWPHGLCSLLSTSSPPSTPPPRAPLLLLPPYATAAPGSSVLAGFVQGALTLKPACVAARASAEHCDACGTAGDSLLSECLRCAEERSPGAASVRVVVEEGRGTGAGADAAAACATCWSLGNEALARRCEQCLSSSSSSSSASTSQGCGRCVTALTQEDLGGGGAAERASRASERVGSCFQCVASLASSAAGNKNGTVEGCVACASSRDPARCGKCLSGAAANFCAAAPPPDFNANADSATTTTRGCIGARDADVCATCVNASGGAAADQCMAAAARSPFSPDVAACAALRSPEHRTGCFACAANAKTPVGGCAECAGLPGDMEMTAVQQPAPSPRRRHLATAAAAQLEPAAAPTTTMAPPNGTGAPNHHDATTLVVAVDAFPALLTTASPARDCAACMADRALDGNDEARSWCFACASRHRDDPANRAACFQCLRRPLDELAAEAAEAAERGGEGEGDGDGAFRRRAVRRARGGAPPGYGDLCR